MYGNGFAKTEGRRHTNRFREQCWFFLLLYRGVQLTAQPLVQSLVKQTRERKKTTVTVQLRYTGSLPHYPLNMTPSLKDFISSKLVLVLRKRSALLRCVGVPHGPVIQKSLLLNSLAVTPQVRVFTLLRTQNTYFW